MTDEAFQARRKRLVDAPKKAMQNLAEYLAIINASQHGSEEPALLIGLLQPSFSDA
jgi:hypothetical protein